MEQRHDVRSHYNIERRRDNTDMQGVRGAHNFAKDALIRGCSCRRVLDVCSGNGGDMGKFHRAGTKVYFGVDIAEVAVDRSSERFARLNPPMQGDVLCMDVLSSQFLQYCRNVNKFDTVSCQFAIHYAFGNEKDAHHIISCVSSALSSEGCFICTIPDAEQLIKRRDIYGKKFGDRFFKVAFDDSESSLEFGHSYSFNLKGAVDSLKEYIVYKDVFVRIANLYGLELELWKNLFEYIEEEREKHPNIYVYFNPVLHDVTKLYVAVKFKKLSTFSPEPNDP